MAQLSAATRLKVKKQVEFYFSDSNLPFDKYMRKTVEDAPDGWVDLSLLVVFARMRALLKVTASDPDDVPSSTIEAVAKCLADSDLVEIGGDGYTIRRKNMPDNLDEIKEVVDRRTLQAAPFPFNTTMEQVAELFGAWGSVRQVRLLRYESAAHFSGRVLVELGSQEEVDAVLAKTVVHEGVQLRMQSKQAYHAALDAAAVKDDAQIVRPVIDDSDLPEDESAPATTEAGAKDGAEAGQPAAESEAAAPEAAAPAAAAPEAAAPAATAAPEPFTAGLLIKVQPEDADSRLWKYGRALRELLGGRDADVAFVERTSDADFAIARCGTPEAAQALLVRADDDGYVEFGTDDDKLKAKVSLVTGDDETEFWDRRSKSQAGKRERDDDAGHGTSKRGRGGRGRGRGRGGRAFRGRRGSS